ncbi:alpha/beta fold hydrolase [Amycolatopsis sp. cg5]|uniref:alpha/beta fold hydrolase n=1 Tax=Amycolatopsis sp. cg5 TaxID=3238802 RepID=UPI003526BE9C
MPTTTSADGTTIAYSKVGSGRPVILVDGAMCFRGMGPLDALAAVLAPDYTVYTYDRRGRGESGDTAPYSVEREVEDLDALIKEAGGSANVFGCSSGAVLALEAATRGLAIEKLALYEPPFIVDDSREIPTGYMDRIREHIAADRRPEALREFMVTGVGMPAIMMVVMRLMPAWKKIKGVAHTLPYDMSVVGTTQEGKPLPVDRWTNITMPTLIADGAKSPAWMRNGVRNLTELLPQAEYRNLAGQNHMVKPKVHAPVLKDFFG